LSLFFNLSKTVSQNSLFLQDPSINDFSFIQFTAQFNKNYGNKSEYGLRKQIFELNTHYISDTNA